MKNVLLLAIATMSMSCSSDEIIKEVPVEVIKEVPVEVIKEVPVIIETNILKKTEEYITTIEKDGSGISHVGAAATLKTEIKKCLDTPEGKNYDMFSIYVGDHRHDRNDISGVAGYGNKGYIIVVFFQKNSTQQIRIYEPYSNRYEFGNVLNYDKFISENFKFSDDFFKNYYSGTMTTKEFITM